MSINITPLSPERLGITGDLETELRIPYDPDEDRFHLAVSDGTLIAGEYDAEADRFHYRVEIEGAGIVRIADGAIDLDWRPEWVTICTYQAGAAPARPVRPLPLFELA
jgi:hypothetical protein